MSEKRHVRTVCATILLLVIIAPSIGAFVAPDDIMQFTDQVVHSQLDWLDLCSVEVLDFRSDTETFDEQIMVEVDLLFICQSEEHARTIAFLIGSAEDFADVYRNRLVSLIRADSARFAETLGIPMVSHALDSGYWSIDDEQQFFVGQRLWVTDRYHMPLALVTVTDRFTHESQEVIEMAPLFASRPIMGGMPLHTMRSPVSVLVQIPVSLQGFGLVTGIEMPLLRTSLRFSTMIGAEYQHGEDAYDLLLRTGVSRRASLGSLVVSTQSLGRWWTNLQLAGSVHLAVGFRLDVADQMHLLYGGEASLELAHHSRSHWYWALSVTYQHRVAVMDAGPQVMRRIVLSPSFGLMW